MRANLLACGHCGSCRIEYRAWVRANDGRETARCNDDVRCPRCDAEDVPTVCLARDASGWHRVPWGATVPADSPPGRPLRDVLRRIAGSEGGGR